MKKSYLVLHTAVILSGFTGIFGKLISLNEGLLVWYRVFFSSILLLIFIKLFKIRNDITVKEKFGIAKIGLFITIQWLFFYASIKYSNISVGVVCYCLSSFFTAFFEPLLNSQTVNRRELLFSLITVVGIALIFHFDSTYHLGIILGISSAAFGALHTIYNKRLVKRYDSRIINYYQMLGGTVVLGLSLPLYLYYFPTPSLVPSMKDTLYLLLLASFCTVVLYVLFAESLKGLSAFTVNLSFNLEPVYAIILAFFIFNESKELNLSFYVGLFFVMASVVLQTIFSRRKASDWSGIM